MSVLLLVAVLVGGAVVVGFALRVLWFLVTFAVLVVAVAFLAHVVGLV